MWREKRGLVAGQVWYFQLEQAVRTNIYDFELVKHA
jgi:hypothetical protein